MRDNLYPLKFHPIFKEKIWGGQKIKSILNKDFSPLPNCGETWEISGVEGNVSHVNGGSLDGKPLTELISSFKDELLGKKVYEQFGDEFPLLVKFIDANADLSVQVHPDDSLAQERHDSFGKTEMWYIFQADEGAQLVSGFNREIDPETYLKFLKEKRLLEILNYENAKAGDVFFLPAGRVHTIGKGLLLAEIQQTSDITYRIYDFDRIDKDGKPRELHTDQALEAIDYTHHSDYRTNYVCKRNQPISLVDCEYFTTNKLNCNQPVTRDYSTLDSFVIFVCFEGALTIKHEDKEYKFEKGDAILLPASIKKVELIPSPEFKVLEAYVPA